MKTDGGSKNGRGDSLREDIALDRALLSRGESIGRILSDEARRRRTLRWAFGGFASVITAIGVFVAVIVMGMGSGTDSRLDPSWFIEDGWKFYNDAEYILAEKRFEIAVEMNPSLLDAWSGLGWSCLREGFVNDAQNAFIKAAKLDSRDPRVNEGLGFVFFANGEYEKAEKHWLAIKKKSAEIQMGLARLYVLQNRFEDALPYAAEAVKQLPDGDLARQPARRRNKPESGRRTSRAARAWEYIARV